MSNRPHHNPRIPNEKWEFHKEEIVQQFVDRNRSLEDIVEALKSSGFIVTKNQLSHRLNKNWRIHKKTTKGKAEALWRSIDCRIAERRRTGKASHVILDGALVESATIIKETGRYSQRAWSSGITGMSEETRFHHELRADASGKGARPKTPPGHLISVCTPRETRGPHDLAYEFAVAQLPVLPSVQVSSVNKELLSKWRDRTFLETSQPQLYRRHGQTSINLSLRIPESEEDSAAQRMKLIMSGSAEEVVQEQLKLIFLQASNKSMFPEDESPHKVWAVLLKLIKLFDSVGLMRKPMDPGTDLTLLAAREELFQKSFYSMTWMIFTSIRRSGRFKRPFHDNVDVIKRFVEWLLRSGQDPNVPVQTYLSKMTSALQCALACDLNDVAAILLHHKADPCGLRPESYTPTLFDCGIHLPPLLLAALAGRRSDDYSFLKKIERNELLLDEIISPSFQQHPNQSKDKYMPENTHPLLNEIFEAFDDELDSLTILQYIKERKGPSWLETPEQSQGLLFHASRQGYLEMLNFVLENNVDINITNRAGATALHNAVLGRINPYKTCSYLLEHGAKLNRGDSVMSAFHLACSQVDDVDVLRLLHSNGPSVHKSIDVTPAAAEYLRIYHNRYEVETDQRLLDKLQKSHTPLKAAINNKRLDVDELGQFLLQLNQDATDVTNLMLESDNVELLLFASRSGNWPDLRLSHCDGLLRNTIECCSDLFQFPELGYCCDKYRGYKEHDDPRTRIVRQLLDAGVHIGTGDAVRALRLGDWDLAQQVRRLDRSGIAALPIPYKEGQLSFLEATILWYPCHALEVAKASRYETGALCAAVSKVCHDELDPDIIESLFINRLLISDASTLDTSVEMAAIGIALYWGRQELVETLQNDIQAPTQTLACLPDLFEGEMRDEVACPLWWHESRLGSVSCFTSGSNPHIFDDTVTRYGWDTTCLSLLVESSDYSKIKTLMNHKHLRQSPTAYRESMQGPLHWSPLMCSIMGHDRKLVHGCLELGEPVNGTCDFHIKCTTPLLEALASGELDIVDLLLERNADVNQAGRHHDLEDSDPRQTPLQVACAKGYLETAKRLIDYGAKIDGTCDNGYTALEHAAANGRIDILQLLLSEGASVVGENRWILDSAISEASRGGHMVAVKLLRDHGKALDQDDKDTEEIEVEEVKADGYEDYSQFEASIVDLGLTCCSLFEPFGLDSHDHLLPLLDRILLATRDVGLEDFVDIPGDGTARRDGVDVDHLPACLPKLAERKRVDGGNDAELRASDQGQSVWEMEIWANKNIRSYCRLLSLQMHSGEVVDGRFA
ncbi:ankyrin [Apiospora marii]|uniref:ankyrin n=1 Tax=Apiospora marii TaxID=335849 RepID=UPI00313209DD